jgi:hypothetical protein
MPYQLNLLGKKKIFINSNNLRNSAFSSKSLSCVQTIATVPIDQPPYSMVNYVSVSDLEKIILSNKTVDMIDIEIVDENNNYVNFRNIDWSITLCLSIEKNDIVKSDAVPVTLSRLSIARLAVEELRIVTAFSLGVKSILIVLRYY